MENHIYITEISTVVKMALEHPPESVRCDSEMLNHEIFMCTKGSADISYGDKKFNISEGCIVFLQKYEKNEYTVDKIEDFECIEIYFDSNLPIFGETHMINTNSNVYIRGLFERIVQIWKFKSSGYYYKCLSIFYELLSEIIRLQDEYVPGERYDKIKPGVKYLQEHCFDKNIDYYTPASLSNISYTYFKRIFIKKIGVTPIQYIVKLRMDRAIELLKTKRYTITEIADMCGYENVYYFSRVFKKHTGVAPRWYIP
ncbi:MAG: helix-turn-helix transcriptional regulator [Ruminococcaceae bacterium]|nr:helix-turn-helix transcriptional regulator [Oscillospiraceae bacterium]